MRRIWIVVMAAALIGTAAGCPKPVSWEIAEKALADGSDLEPPEVHQQLQKALKRAAEEIAKDPEDPGPYVTMASLLWIKRDMDGAEETLRTALERCKPKTEAQKQKLKEYTMAFYYRADTPEMLRRGVNFVENLIKTENDRKNVYCYYMALYYRKLYKHLGEGVYKTEANRWALQCRMDPEMEAEFKREGLYDPFLK
ncbi:MAG: hypothetical protein ACYS47_00280 [Planctomycetota bacterium]